MGASTILARGQSRKQVKNPLISLARNLRSSQLFTLAFTTAWLLGMTVLLGLLLHAFERDGEVDAQVRVHSLPGGVRLVLTLAMPGVVSWCLCPHALLARVALTPGCQLGYMDLF
jgi:hypothetical protein